MIGAAIAVILVTAMLLVFFSIQRLVRKIEAKMPVAAAPEYTTVKID
jgi:hypothetical protein